MNSTEGIRRKPPERVLPDDVALNARDIERYYESYDRFYDTLPQVIRDGFLKDEATSVRLIEFVSKDYRVGLIKEYFKIGREELLLIFAVELIERCRITDCADILSMAMDNKYLNVRKKAAEKINFAELDKRADLIVKGMNSGNREISLICAKKAKLVEPRRIKEIVELGLNSIPEVALACADAIDNALPADQENLRQTIEGIIRNNKNDFKYRQKLIRHAPIKSRKDLILLFFNCCRRSDVCTDAAMAISYVDENDQAEVQAKLLEIITAYTTNPLVVFNNVELIRYVAPDKRAALIKQYLANTNTFIVNVAIDTIQFLSQAEQTELKQYIFNNCSETAQRRYTSIYEQKSSDEEKQTTSEHKKIDFSQVILKEDINNYDRLVELASNVSVLFDKKSFVQFYSKRNRQKIKIHHGKQSKIVTKKTNPLALVLWKKAFEANDLWAEEGFECAPIEPIVSVLPDAKIDEVYVVSRLIQGPSVLKWYDTTDLWKNSISEQMRRILFVLRKIGVSHGDAEDRNFVLYFKRGEDGKPDITKPPRVFLIDFEMAYLYN